MSMIPMPMTPTGLCWICGGNSFRHVWTDKFDLTDHPRFGVYAHAANPDSRLMKCRSCGFAQPEELPAIPDYFEILYRDQPWLSEEAMALDYERGAKDQVFQAVLSTIRERLAPDLPRTLLDVGTYIGRFLELATVSRFDAEGIELNTRAADFAERRTGRPIHRLNVQDLAELGKKFGVVTLIDVLEHIPDPRPVLKSLRRLLLPGGVLVVKVPHGTMQRLKERIRGLRVRTLEARAAKHIEVMTRFVHVNHFTPRSLARCLSASGFESVRVVSSPPDFQREAGGRGLRESLGALGRVASYRLARIVPGGVDSPLSFHLLASAVKGE